MTKTCMGLCQWDFGSKSEVYKHDVFMCRWLKMLNKHLTFPYFCFRNGWRRYIVVLGFNKYWQVLSKSDKYKNSQMTEVCFRVYLNCVCSLCQSTVLIYTLNAVSRRK